MPIQTIYDFLIKKKLVEDRQQANKLMIQQIGGVTCLQNPKMMCYDEFNKLFCKGMFKVALINTLENLKSDEKGIKAGVSGDKVPAASSL